MPEIPKERYETWARWAGWKPWSRETVTLFNEAVKIWSVIDTQTKDYLTANAETILDEISAIEDSIENLRGRITRAHWYSPRIAVDIEEIKKAETRVRLPYALEEGADFDMALGMATSILRDAKILLSEKIREFIEYSKDLYRIYYDPQTKTYLEIHPVTGEVVKEEKTIEIEFTAALETRGGHQFFSAEVTGVITITEQDKANFELIYSKIIEEVEKQVGELFDKGKKRGKRIADLVKPSIDKVRAKERVIKEGMSFTLSDEEANFVLTATVEKLREGRFGPESKQMKITEW